MRRSARHTPEDGFIVDQVDAWVIRPNGREEKIAFRYFRLRLRRESGSCGDAVARAIRIGEAKRRRRGNRRFAANPNLFRSRWMVGIPSSPLQLPAGSRLKVHLTQTENVTDKPALVKRARLAASGDSRGQTLSKDPDFGGGFVQLTKLTSRAGEDSHR